MRTVDPQVWAGKSHKAPISKSFGRPINNNIEGLLRKSFKNVLREYADTTCFEIVKNILQNRPYDGRRVTQRCVYMCVFGMGIALLSFSAYRRDTVPPHVVTLPFVEHSIANIKFPAVAICSYNLLSKYRLLDYARELYAKDKRKRYSTKTIYDNLVNFGKLVDMSTTTSDIEFTQYIRRIDPDRGYNITNLILRLTAPCDRQLIHCSWRGETYDCNDIFALRATPFGFCCVFNGRYEKYDIWNEPKMLKVVGRDEGLGVVIKRNMSDFAYVRRPTLGSEVLLFDGTEYPLLESGCVKSYSAPLNVSAYFVLSATEQVATKSVAYINENRRLCHFKELDGARTSSSSYAWCLTMCRRNAIKELCGCVPYFLLPRPNHFLCSLNQLSCLNKHKEKLLIYFPQIKPQESVWHEGLDEEHADSLDCSHCKPDCTKTRFKAAVYASKYYDRYKIFKNYFTNNVLLGNSTVLRIFYSTEDQLLSSLETTERWYEALAVMGSEAVVLVGASLLLLPELLFFLTVRWCRHYRALRRPGAFVKRNN